MNRFALPEGSNWIVVLAIFGASISLAGFTSKWLTAAFPALGRYGFLVYLCVTTGYFSLLTMLMKNLM